MIKVKKEEFKHRITVTVRFNEVDIFGVCNNAVYLNYFEHARLQYLKHLGLMPENGLFPSGKLYFMVHNEINYKSHAHFDDELIVYTKISSIKNSSFRFEHIVENSKSKKIVATGAGVMAQVDQVTRKTSCIPDEFCRAVIEFEGDVKILRSKKN